MSNGIVGDAQRNQDLPGQATFEGLTRRKDAIAQTIQSLPESERGKYTPFSRQLRSLLTMTQELMDVRKRNWKQFAKFSDGKVQLPSKLTKIQANSFLKESQHPLSIFKSYLQCGAQAGRKVYLHHTAAFSLILWDLERLVFVSWHSELTSYRLYKCWRSW